MGGHTGGVSRRISSPELIGRAAEVAALAAALADAQRGRGRLVLVEGDAGIGKTRLVEDFAAQANGARVLAGGGIPLASDTPYAPVLGILQALARLHPAVAGGLLPQGAPGPPDPFGPTRLLAAAADAVRAVAARTPLVLVVEDLHWADASTCGLVSFLARAVRRDPVLLLLTARSEELDPARPVSVLISELARVAQLPAAGQQVLGAASVLGRAMSHRLLAAVAEPADLDGLAAAVSHRLLEPRNDGYRFRHPLIQETAYAQLLPRARQALHARAAAALAEMHPPAELAGRAGHAVQIAFQWQQAGQDGPALAAAVRAGDLAQAAHAPAEALTQYTLAIAGWQN